MSHPNYRTSLISKELSVEEILKMKKEDFLSEDAKLQIKRLESEKFQAVQTNWQRQKDQERREKLRAEGKNVDSFFACRKCRKKNTTFY